MAITCHVCNQPLDALAGGRCRQCRQLVCADCVADGAANDPAGLICVDCIRSAPAAASPDPANGPEAQVVDDASAMGATASPGATPRHDTESLSPPRPLHLPRWAWIAAGALLSALFLALVAVPMIQVRGYLHRIRTGNRREVIEAADALARINSGHARQTLARMAEEGASNPEQALRAIRALGRWPTPEARAALERARANARPRGPFADAIEEALLEQERIGATTP